MGKLLPDFSNKKFKEMQKELERNSDIVEEFGAYAAGDILAADANFSFSKSDRGRRCRYMAIVERGWSIECRIKLVYCSFPEYRETSQFSQPDTITIRNISADHYIEPLPSAIMTYPRKQLTRMENEYIRSGKHGELFYDSIGLLSFPDAEQEIHLAKRERVTLKTKIHIPSDFPEELINKRIAMRIKAETSPVRLAINSNGLYTVVVA
jgi:hypothetical protein